jgi:hypothetical protein
MTADAINVALQLSPIEQEKKFKDDLDDLLLSINDDKIRDLIHHLSLIIRPMSKYSYKLDPSLFHFVHMYDKILRLYLNYHDNVYGSLYELYMYELDAWIGDDPTYTSVMEYLRILETRIR